VLEHDEGEDEKGVEETMRGVAEGMY